MKSVKMVNFSDIFYFAEKEYQIHWNTANNLFFRNDVFEYGSVKNIYPGDARAWFRDIDAPKGFKSSDIPKERFVQLCDSDKAWIILLAYCEKNKIKHDFMVDAR
jgi:hypothetical protein